jgi:periplasmic divalent cation tolerance protein
LEESNETVLIAKTREELFEDLVARVIEEHSYSVPCVIRLPIEGGNPTYLQWLAGETESIA